MKSLKLTVLAITLIGIFGAGNALAASATHDLTINAKVAGTCKFVDAATTLDLGDLPFSATTGLSTGDTGNVDIEFWCTKGIGYTVAASSANGGTLDGLTTTTETIDYTQTLTGTTGTGAGPNATAAKVNVKIDVDPGGYDDVSAQSYQDVVTLSFSL